MYGDYFVKAKRVDEIKKTVEEIVVILNELNQINGSLEELNEELKIVSESISNHAILKPKGHKQDIYNAVIAQTVTSLWENKETIIKNMRYQRFTDIINIFKDGSKESEANKL